MTHTRRRTLQVGVGLGLATLMPALGRAQDMEGHVHATEGGEIRIHPVQHASFVMTTPSIVIYVDPVEGAAAYHDLPRPELILITHEHGDHYDVETLRGIVGAETRLITNPAVHDMLPDDLKERATAIANGESTMVNDTIQIEAVPAYNTTPDRQQYHPEGRDNGYVLGIDGLRVYIAGDTEDIPEMRALEGIDIAFLPMNLPYTMTVEQAAAGVEAFAPRVVYPYHYGESDIDAFTALVADGGSGAEVVRGDWY